jgi:hypothetical protein
MKRGKAMKRGGRIKPKRRPVSEQERIYGPHEFREWLHDQPCAVCGAWSGHTEQAHVGNEGKSRKAGWRRSIPLCGPRSTPCPGSNPLLSQMWEGCHRELHRIGVTSFEAKHRVSLEAVVAQTQARWRAHGRD